MIKVTKKTIFKALKPSFSSISNMINASKGPSVRLDRVKKIKPSCVLMPVMANKVHINSGMAHKRNTKKTYPPLSLSK